MCLTTVCQAWILYAVRFRLWVAHHCSKPSSLSVAVATDLRALMTCIPQTCVYVTCKHWQNYHNSSWHSCYGAHANGMLASGSWHRSRDSPFWSCQHHMVLGNAMWWFKVGAAQGSTAGINGVLLCMLSCCVAKWIHLWSWYGDWGLLVKGIKY